MNCFSKIKLGALMLGVMFLVSCGNGGNSHTRATREWKTQTIAKSNKNTTTRYSASIQGRQDVEIRPQVSGVIESVYINEGEKVRKGQILFIIDQVPYRAALNEAIASVNSAKASLATAKLNYESRQRLYREQVISAYAFLTSTHTNLNSEAQLPQIESAEP